MPLKTWNRCGSTCVPWSLGQRGDGLVNRGDGAGAVAGGWGDALHGAGVDVADREHAGNAGLERKRPPSRRGPGRSEVIAGQLDVGPDETIVPGSDPGQPARGGPRADEAEPAPTGLGFRRFRPPVRDADLLPEHTALYPGGPS